MKRFFRAFISASVLVSSIASACPDGQYEMCVAPRPWPLSGCAQNICVVSSGTVIQGTTDVLADLNQGVISLGNGAINASTSVGRRLNTVANQIDPTKVDWSTGALIGVAVVNGLACIASDGASPGQGIDGSTVVCSENACACAAISLAMAVKNRSNMSDDEKQKTNQVVNDQRFETLINRPDIVSATTHQISTLGMTSLSNAPTPSFGFIKTIHARYVTATYSDEGWVLRAATTNPLPWERFEVVPLGNNQVALKTVHGKYVTATHADERWVLRGAATVIGPWEKFELLPIDSNKFALKTVHGRFVTATYSDESWLLRAETTQRLDWEVLTFEWAR